jgi:hypothetical protein
LKIFLIEKKKKHVVCIHFFFFIHVHKLASLEGSSVLRHKLTINVTSTHTCTITGPGEWRNFGIEKDHFQEWRLIFTSFDGGKEDPRPYASLKNTCKEYNSDFNHQHFLKFPKDFVWFSLGNCPQHCKQDLPKKSWCCCSCSYPKKNFVSFLD